MDKMQIVIYTLRDLKFKEDTEIQTQTESYIENSKVIMLVLERFLHSPILHYTYSSCMDKENNGKNNWLPLDNSFVLEWCGVIQKSFCTDFVIMLHKYLRQ